MEDKWPNWWEVLGDDPRYQGLLKTSWAISTTQSNVWMLQGLANGLNRIPIHSRRQMASAGTTANANRTMKIILTKVGLMWSVLAIPTHTPPNILRFRWMGSIYNDGSSLINWTKVLRNPGFLWPVEVRCSCSSCSIVVIKSHLPHERASIPSSPQGDL